MADKADPVAHTAGWLSEATDGASEAGTRAQASRPAKDARTALARANAVRPAHRPTDYSHELATAICELLVTREEDGRVRTLRDVCRLLELTEGTVYSWLTRHQDFQDMYDRARDTRADMIAEDITEIADTDTDVQRAKNRMLARQWAASKLSPRKWGDRTTVAGDKDNPLVFDPLGQVLGAVTGKTRGIPSDKG